MPAAPPMAGISSVLVKIQAAQVKTRKAGLEDLQRILDHDRNSTGKQKLNDEGYHKILKEIFTIIEEEKSSFVRRSRTTDNKLSSLVEALRRIVEHGFRVFRRKRSAPALIAHILQASLGSDGQIYEPLARSYARILRCFLGYRPHADSLNEEEWRELVSLCVLGLTLNGSFNDSDDDESVEPSNVHASTRKNALSGSSTPLTLSVSFRSNGKSRPMVNDIAGNQAVEDFCACLAILASVPHQPILSISNGTLEAVCRFLDRASQSSFLQTQEHAFSTLNSLLSAADLEAIDTAICIVRRSLPYLTELWHAKAHTELRQQILIFLLRSKRLFSKILAEVEQFSTDLQQLADTLFIEYSKRREAEMLHPDDLIFGDFTDYLDKPAMTGSAFQLRTGFARSEQAWSILSILGGIVAMRASISASSSSEVGERQSHMFKRRKIEHPIMDIAQKIDSSSRSEKLATLQLAVFLAEDSSLEAKYQEVLLTAVIPCVTSEDSHVANWALMVATSLLCNLNNSIHAGSQNAAWDQLWKLSCRALAISGQCRTAAHLMACILKNKLLAFHAVVESIDTMLNSIDLSGPTALFDSTCYFWRQVLQHKFQYTPASAFGTSERICQWLFKHWDPANIRSVSKRAPSFETTDIVLLLEAIVGNFEAIAPISSNMKRGDLAMVVASLNSEKSLSDFLILKGDSRSPPREVKSEESSASSSDARVKVRLHEILDYLSKQMESLLHSGFLLNPATNDRASSELVMVTTTVAIAGISIASGTKFPPSSISRTCKNQAIALTKGICNFIQQSNNAEAGLDGLFAALSQLISVPSTGLASIGAHEVARCYQPEFWASLNAKAKETSVDDMMIIDESFDSQTSRSKSDTQDTVRSRQMEGGSANSQSYRACQKLRMALAFYISQRSVETDTQVIADEFFDRITDMKGDDLLNSRLALCEILTAGMTFSERATSILLQHIGSELLAKDEYERLESAHCMTLEVLRATVPLWIRADSEASDTAEQLYEWFVKVALPRRLLSSATQVELGRLIQKIMELNPRYGNDLVPEIPQDVFLRLFEEGSSAVKYALGKNLARIFKSFILQEHDAILDAIFSSLPVEPNCLESTAVRLRVMTWLGSSWPTLLRRCLYAICEAPILVPKSNPYAEKCFKLLASNLNLSCPQDLYQLFASQIIYTWLDGHSILELPFSVFGYETMKDFLLGSVEEICAQLIMRGHEEELDKVSSACGKEKQDLLHVSFSRAAAYCLGRDASIRPEVDPKASNGVMRLKTLLGKDEFAEFVPKSLPKILSTLFKLTEREESFNRGLERHQSFSAATNVWEEIISSGASQAPVEVSQQPSFKSSSLMDQIEFLRSIIEIPSSMLWTPAMYTYIFRDIMSMIHPALGSLNTCTVIRRLRILISIVGDAALRDYPLEMALHALRNFINDSQCAEDVIGICRYLLSHATTYLQTHPSFLIGFAVSTMVSLRVFMETPRDSTTQESNHIATISRAREFHAWLHKLVSNYSSPNLDNTDHLNMKNIADAASQIRNAGTSQLGTPEGELMKGVILGSSQKGYVLINDSAREAILEVLCTQFDPTPNYREDVLGEDDLAHKCAKLLFQSLLNRDRHPGFRLWIARVLGRAYAGRGPKILKELKSITTTPQSGENSLALSHPINGSRRNVLEFLGEMLHNNDLKYVKAAEAALHSTFSVHRNPGDPMTDCLDEIPVELKPAFIWTTWTPSVQALASPEVLKELKLADQLRLEEETEFGTWLRKLCTSLIACCQTDSFVPRLAVVIENIPEAAQKLFSPILHMALLLGSSKQDVRGTISNAFRQWMDDSERVPKSSLKLALNAILYLRRQPLLNEENKSDRDYWLDIDYKLAASAAICCEMYTTALLFLEISISTEINSTSRRATTGKADLPVDLLLKIYQNVDEKDSFYGIRQPSTLSSMMQQLEFENSGFKSLSFRSAYYDSQTKHGRPSNQLSDPHVVRLLDDVQLNGISLAMITNAAVQNPEIQNAMFTTARKLERWDLTAPSRATTQPAVIFKAFQDIYDKSDPDIISRHLDAAYFSTLSSILNASDHNLNLHSGLQTLGVLTEIEDVITSRDMNQVQEAYDRLADRTPWMVKSSYDIIKNLDSCRQTIFGVLDDSTALKFLTKLKSQAARIMHVRALLASSNLNRHHKGLQSSLNIVTYLTQSMEKSEELGVKVDAAISLEASHVLWDQGEISPSIRMLEHTLKNVDLQNQDILVGKAQVLAVLAHRISEARLEKPDEVIEIYLKPAIKELKGATVGSEAGQVYHEFAAFCDLQLQNPDVLEDLRRIESLRDKKKSEVNELDAMLKAVGPQSKEADAIKNIRSKSKRWYELDDREYQRLKDGREALLGQSLENYLLCLRACDDHDNDALRFSALWLENYDKDVANAAVKNQIEKVPSRKLASLMNQWTSRQQNDDSDFQKQLFNLMWRICSDHPYHGMYHVFTSSKGKGAKDPMALSRNAAAIKLADKLKNNKQTSQTWIAIHNSNVNFVRFAMEKPLEGKAKEGAKIPMAQTINGPKLEKDIRAANILPPTMTIPLNVDCNYESIPHIHKYLPEFSLASGISMPKIVTAVTSDGQRFKQLYKSGNDDLRQDAIMEQVFEQVSSLLKHHPDTRQRDLKIRTYKVLPLTSSTGIIEFVVNTIPLNNYLMPAHQTHYPRDMKPSECRRAVADASGKTTEERVRTFRKICDKFHPVLRFFFTDRFLDPEDWFEKRLMFSRSTAAISMLGYILGLGDRHGQNILLDEKTGEVVHIDLGIAFETGRVLPIPEVVPFRLTRDLVDGMGITGTEGVFRRCCEFMLGALRKEEYSIMTILDVLRYDPLYNWSVSPLRMKRLQDDQMGVEMDDTVAGKIRDKAVAGSTSSERKDEEAERALTVVRKKLSKSLSVTATVNELIEQATDSRNLAVLFAGWAAYL